jgi:hypothetical protein
MIEKLLCVTLLCGSPALATGKGGASFAATASTTSSTSTTAGRGGGGNRAMRIDPRQPPPLDPERKVTEQDCTKPVDLTAGNLRCK